MAKSSNTTRRAFLSAGAVAAVTTVVAPASALLAPVTVIAPDPLVMPAEHKALVDRIRRLHVQFRAAVDVEVRQGEFRAINGRACKPYRRAVRATEAIEAKLDKLETRILDRPVKSWADVAVLAELAKARDPDFHRGDPGLAALHALLGAALQMGEGAGHVTS